MEDYKLEAAKGGLNLIKAGQKIGFGAGSSIFYLIDMITKNEVLVQSLSFPSSSFKPLEMLIGNSIIRMGIETKVVAHVLHSPTILSNLFGLELRIQFPTAIRCWADLYTRARCGS